MTAELQSTIAKFIKAGRTVEKTVFVLSTVHKDVSPADIRRAAQNALREHNAKVDAHNAKVIHEFVGMLNAAGIRRF